ncbi:MAG: Eco57I restriction-modification methylase domain-containing protein [Bryobacteraceae bacterium]
MTDLLSIEGRRLSEQERLDSLKSGDERNEWGQFATPPSLAVEILQLAQSLWGGNEKVRFLDPAIGTGSFYSALLRVFGSEQVAASHGVELDPLFAKTATSLWQGTGLSVANADFTTQCSPQSAKYNLLVSNPPYVRHHHMAAEYKAALKERVFERVGIRVSGLAGLYASFLLLCDSWLAPGALSVWLIPSEFMDVNYGEAVRNYLTSKVELLRIHRFCPADVQFSDALVSSAVVVFRKNAPKADSVAQMSFGGPLLAPRDSAEVPVRTLRESKKWSGFPNRRTERSYDHAAVRLGDLFSIKRGLATGSNSFFILEQHEAQRAGIPKEFQRPILPGPRHVRIDIVEGDLDGSPLTSPRLTLIDCSLTEDEIKLRYPLFWKYLETGKTTGVHETYLASKRRPWYSQEKRPPAPFVCTYMGRTRNGKKPFRVIWNKSNATAANVYLLLYPKPALAAALRETPELYSAVFDQLRSIETDTFIDEGRVYGGGLHKMEPKELERVPLQGLADLLNVTGSYRGQMGLLFDTN